MYTYLLINFLTILLPVLFSFENRVCYARKWKHLFSALLITAFFFIVWDSIFTLKGVWGFNQKYLLGIEFFGLPIEEMLFFICIPFSCLFIYEIIRHFQKTDKFALFTKIFANLLIVISGIIGILHWDKVYTSVTFLLLALFLAAHLYLIKSDYLGHFFQMYLITIIPFLIVNGLLTNGLKFIDAGPVVWYNNAENLSFRIINIPLEDFFYSMLMLLMNTTFYEYFKNKK